MQPPHATLDNVVAFVRATTGLGPQRAIVPETRLGADLGVTGDDGVDLLAAAERHFSVALTSEAHGVREAFGLRPDEVLFGAEGLDPFGWLIGSPRPVVRDLTVAELQQAIATAPPAG